MENDKLAANDKNEKHYFTGRPCKYGHISIRWANTGNCNQCYRTTHAESRKKVSRLRKNKYSQNIKNKNALSMRKAYNAHQRWTLCDIKKLISVTELGNYIYTEDNLSKILGRSIKSINRARSKYKDT